MNEEKKTKADQHDHNDHLPKDVLNLEQDPNSFKDPLEQQLKKTEQSKANASDESLNDDHKK